MVTYCMQSLQMEETAAIDYNAGQACNVVIKVFTAWNRVRNMFATVLMSSYGLVSMW